MFSDPSHHHAGSTVWYRGRGGGWAVHWSVFLPTSVARAELQYPCTPRGALGESHLEPHAALVLFVQVAVAHLPFLPLVSYVLTLHSYFLILEY